MNKIFDIALVLAIAFVLTLKPSYAYLDPGTGSYLFQMAIAGLLGALFAVKQFWQQIKSFILIKILRKSEASS